MYKIIYIRDGKQGQKLEAKAEAEMSFMRTRPKTEVKLLLLTTVNVRLFRFQGCDNLHHKVNTKYDRRQTYNGRLIGCRICVVSRVKLVIRRLQA